jgi:hypothetical protein
MSANPSAFAALSGHSAALAALSSNQKALSALAAQPKLAAVMANPSFAAAASQAGYMNGRSAWGHESAALLGAGRIAYVELPSKR